MYGTVQKLILHLLLTHYVFRALPSRLHARVLLEIPTEGAYYRPTHELILVIPSSNIVGLLAVQALAVPPIVHVPDAQSAPSNDGFTGGLFLPSP